jgi:hypothetical protein
VAPDSQSLLVSGYGHRAILFPFSQGPLDFYKKKTGPDYRSGSVSLLTPHHPSDHLQAVVQRQPNTLKLIYHWRWVPTISLGIIYF